MAAVRPSRFVAGRPEVGTCVACPGTPDSLRPYGPGSPWCSPVSAPCHPKTLFCVSISGPRMELDSFGRVGPFSATYRTAARGEQRCAPYATKPPWFCSAMRALKDMRVACISTCQQTMSHWLCGTAENLQSARTHYRPRWLPVRGDE
jgi:hypothetical protein